VRAGLRYLDPAGGFDLEANLVWEGWSSFDQVTFETKGEVYYRDVPTIGDYLVEFSPLIREFEDTWSGRFGASVRPFTWVEDIKADWLTLRLGGYYETGAAPPAYFSVATADADKWALAIGVGTVLGSFEIDLGYVHVFQLDVDISPGTSRYVQTNPSNPEGAIAVGDGYKETYNDVFGLSVLVRIDDWF
jgi:long-subunit fatty acid transport protein